MSTKRGGQQAYPTPALARAGEWAIGPPGMTIREAFAKDAPAMPAEWFAAYMELHGKVPRFSAVETMETIRAASVEWARSYADALLAALAEEKR